MSNPSLKLIGKFIKILANPNTNPIITRKCTNIYFSRTPITNTRTNIHILKIANKDKTFLGYFGPEIPKSFVTQVYLYPTMQVIGHSSF